MILTKSADVEGKDLLGADSIRLGPVRGVFLDLEAGRVMFVVVEAAGLLGGSEKLHPAPWQAVRVDQAADAFRIEMTKDDFSASQSYGRMSRR